MDSDFAAKLKIAIGEASPLSVGRELVVIPAKRAVCPANFKGNIQEAFARYRKEYAGKDFEDPRGISVTLLEQNFPKLVKLMFRPDPSKPAQKARAKAVLDPLRNGTFDRARHFSDQPARLRSLFWIEEVICQPDGIHPNCAALVEGEEVYFKHYDRPGSDTKLVFTAIGHCGQRIVITSFFDESAALHKYCGLPCFWPNEKGHL